MYWLVFSTLYWSASFGHYGSKTECMDAALTAPWYASAVCVPEPVKAK